MVQPRAAASLLFVQDHKIKDVSEQSYLLLLDPPHWDPTRILTQDGP